MCDVEGCKNEAVRSLPRKKLEKLFNLEPDGRRAHICKQHYKEYKKKTKMERRIEQLDWR